MSGYTCPRLGNEYTSQPALTVEEIQELFDELDEDKDGRVSTSELRSKWKEALESLIPRQKHCSSSSNSSKQVLAEEGISSWAKTSEPDVEAFLRWILPEEKTEYSEEQFVRHFQEQGLVSLEEAVPDDSLQRCAVKLKLPFRKRIRAYWSVHGPDILFIACIISLQLAFGLWQMAAYLQKDAVLEALGWGIVCAKFCAGVLYPTMAFMLLSMSRYLNSYIRLVGRPWSRFVNYDHSRIFHIAMAVVGLFFGTLHGISHLAGDMVYSTQAEHKNAFLRLIEGRGGDDEVSYIKQLQGWSAVSGLVSLGLFWIIAFLSLPWVRKRWFEAFQVGHLLMVPLIGLLCSHGAISILQKPMLGYWLAFPTLLVLAERIRRFVWCGSICRLRAHVEILNGNAVLLTCRQPLGRKWSYRAGQYVLVQVPKISSFQWHPFTVSSWRGDELRVHIKTEGCWTKALKDIGQGGIGIEVGIDGPFGAPAQRFNEYNYSIVIGNGIGVTPLAAILEDLADKIAAHEDSWDDRQSHRRTAPLKSTTTQLIRLARPSSPRPANDISYVSMWPMDFDREAPTTSVSGASTPTPGLPDIRPRDEHLLLPRRVDFHWTVREAGNIPWFVDLLNEAIKHAEEFERRGRLRLHINTYITAKAESLLDNVLMRLLDSLELPASALTGLKRKSRFARPDFQHILDRHFDDLLQELAAEVAVVGVKEKKVGVFYCGTPVVGKIISNQCHELTAKARTMGLKIRYNFHTEVFG